MSNIDYHEKNLDDPQTWKESGNDFFNKGQYEEAIKCFGHAIQLDPNYIDAWNNMGLSLLKIGKIEEAKECNEKVKKLKGGKISQSSKPSIPIPPFSSENQSFQEKSVDLEDIKKKYENGDISYVQYQNLIEGSPDNIDRSYALGSESMISHLEAPSG